MQEKYSKKEEAFILKCRRKKMSHSDIHKAFNSKFKKSKTFDGIRYKTLSLSRTHNLKTVSTEQDTKNLFLEKFKDVVVRLGHIPKLAVFIRESKLRDQRFRQNNSSYDSFILEAKEKYPEVFSKFLDSSEFSKDYFAELLKDIKKYKRFVITTAVSGCEPHEAGLKSIQAYCKANKAKLLIIPVSDPAGNKTKQYEFTLHPKLPTEGIVFKNLALNSNLIVSTIKLGAKQIKPLTGLRELSNYGSVILGSPKQMLEHHANSNKKDIPRALMTTGAITLPDYDTTFYMSERTAYLAKEHHKLGAVIVEIKDDRVFFSRRIQINPKTGEFCDLNKKYSPNGKIQKIKAELVQQPDWHVGSTDPVFRAASKKLVSYLKPKYMTFEDFFDGLSINPHEKHNIVERSKRIAEGLTLEKELRMCSDEINDLINWEAEILVFKYGNHEDFLKRWLNTAEYKDDTSNHYEGVCLAKALLEGDAPFEYAMRHRYSISRKKQIKFLGINDSFKVNGIENATHGHIGSGGKRNPGMAGLEAYGPCNTGHSHSAAIFRDVVRVGTATKLQLSYNDGASNWTQTLNIQHKDGARQLITFIDGECCLPDILK